MFTDKVTHTQTDRQTDRQTKVITIPHHKICEGVKKKKKKFLEGEWGKPLLEGCQARSLRHSSGEGIPHRNGLVEEAMF